MSEENKNVELKEEELEKVSGGWGTNDVETYEGYSVGNSHTVPFSDSMGSGQYTVKIEKIQPINPGPAKFQVGISHVYDSGMIVSGSTFWTKSQLDEFWSR